MEQIQETLNLLEIWLSKNIAPNGFLDNVVEYMLPIASMLTVIIGGVWTVYTYVKGKNKETNEKILENVYLPLFQFFATNDSLTQIGSIAINDYKKTPLLEWGRKLKTVKMEIGNTTVREEKSDVLGLTRAKLLEAIEKVNLGLAPKGLVALISAYKATNYAVEHFTGDNEIYRRAIDYRDELEYSLRVEAYKGYQKYHKRLGLLNGTTLGFFNGTKRDVFKLCKDHIQLALKPLPKECEKKFEDDEND